MGPAVSPARDPERDRGSHLRQHQHEVLAATARAEPVHGRLLAR